MHYIPTTLVVATVAGSLALLCGFRGQGEQDPTKSPSAVIARQRADTDADDGMLAFWLVADSKNVVTLSRLAQQRAQDSEVKRFAATMVTEHEQLLEKLRPFAKDADFGGSTPARGNAGTDTRGTDARGTDTRGTAAPAGSQRMPAGDVYPHTRLLQELADQCLSSAQAELEKKTGPQFDLCFMGMAVGGHMHAIDKLTVFERHVSGDLKNVLTEAEQNMRVHLDEAKLIVSKLESKDPRIVSPNRDAK